MSSFLRLWVSKLLSKPRRLPAVKFHEANPITSTLLSVVAYLLRLQAQFAWRVLFSNGFLEHWDTCILMVVAWVTIWTPDITGYVFLALQNNIFPLLHSILPIAIGRRSQKWTLGAWATSSCRNRWSLILSNLHSLYM